MFIKVYLYIFWSLTSIPAMRDGAAAGDSNTRGDQTVFSITLRLEVFFRFGRRRCLKLPLNS